MDYLKQIRTLLAACDALGLDPAHIESLELSRVADRLLYSVNGGREVAVTAAQEAALVHRGVPVPEVQPGHTADVGPFGDRKHRAVDPTRHDRLVRVCAVLNLDPSDVLDVVVRAESGPLGHYLVEAQVRMVGDQRPTEEIPWRPLTRDELDRARELGL